MFTSLSFQFTGGSLLPSSVAAESLLWLKLWQLLQRLIRHLTNLATRKHLTHPQ